ncbi:MAG: hypothetical protein ACRDEA_05580 [Microcystaceae cyanobacterium]
MNEQENLRTGTSLTAAQEFLCDLWEKHVRYEFATGNTEDTLSTMVEVPLVAIVHFREGKLASEHIYWDQASVLVQLGLLDAGTLPVAGIESACKSIDPSLPSNTVLAR